MEYKLDMHKKQGCHKWFIYMFTKKYKHGQQWVDFMYTKKKKKIIY